MNAALWVVIGAMCVGGAWFCVWFSREDARLTRDAQEWIDREARRRALQWPGRYPDPSPFPRFGPPGRRWLFRGWKR